MVVKYFSMAIDARTVTLESVGLTEGEISIFDMKDFSLRHFWKIAGNISAIRLFTKYLQEAIPLRISHSHYINCSPVFIRFFNLVRPFLKKELSDMLHFYSDDYKQLYEFIPQELLPAEYGGNAGSREEIFQESLKLIDLQRDFIMDERNWQLSNVKA